MKKLKNKLDEMQELNLLNIEKRGFWIAYCGLIIAIVVQIVLYKQDVLRYAAGETIVLFLSGGYACVAGIRKGIWSRRIPATPISNLVQSVTWSGVFAVFLMIMRYVQTGSLEIMVVSGISFFIIMTVVCFVLLSLMMLFYKQRKIKQEKQFED